MTVFGFHAEFAKGLDRRQERCESRSTSSTFTFPSRSLLPPPDATTKMMMGVLLKTVTKWKSGGGTGAIRDPAPAYGRRCEA